MFIKVNLYVEWKVKKYYTFYINKRYLNKYFINKPNKFLSNI